MLTPALSDFTPRLHQLDELLRATAGYWQPQPFKGDPAWVAVQPQLAEWLLELQDDEVAALMADGAQLRQLLIRFVPALGELDLLVTVPAAELPPPVSLTPHLQWAIPGRKWAQIEAFARAAGEVAHPLLEWCGGKGHLGRLLAVQAQQPVTTFEYNSVLCGNGEQLAKRARVAQTFHVVDVLGPVAGDLLQGKHAVALHACGELHRRLLRLAVEEQMPAFDIVPCCYHLGGEEDYRPFSEGVALQLSRDDLRLAVTQTATAAPREVVARNQEMAWKLGFDQLRRDLSEDVYCPIKSINKQWLKLDFAGFCQQLAGREGLQLPAGIDWAAYEQQGWQRQQRVMRLNLLRAAFARPLELWLVLDMAVWLQGQGYEVAVKEFCGAELTPRNLMLSARRRS